MRVVFVLLFVSIFVGLSAQQADNYRPLADVVLDSTNLPIVFINVDHQMIYMESKITGRMTIIHNGEGRMNYADTVLHPGQTIDYDGYISIKYRGATSFSASPKKPYNIRTLAQPLEAGGKKQKVNLLGMGSDNDWALMAPYADKSLMRDLLTYKLAEPYFEWVPEGRFCEVILDSVYYGVYVLQEKVSKGKTRLNLDDPGETGDRLTGGYIVEVDRIDGENTYQSPYEATYTDLTPIGNGINVVMDTPDNDDISSSQRDYIHSRLRAMEDALWDDAFDTEPRGYSRYIDVQSFVDFQLSQEFTHNIDAYRLSAKMYKRRDSQDPLFHAMIWDFNFAYGNVDYDDGFRTDTWMYLANDVIISACMQPFWWIKLNRDPQYAALVAKRWQQYRREAYSNENIYNTIDSLAQQLTVCSAIERNSAAWPVWGRSIWPAYYVAESFEDEIGFLKDWIGRRVKFMDNELFPVGDVNLDGLVNVGDISACYGVLTGVETNPRADVNKDEVYNVGDLSSIYRIIHKSFFVEERDGSPLP